MQSAYRTSSVMYFAFALDAATFVYTQEPAMHLRLALGLAGHATGTLHVRQLHSRLR